MSLSRLPRQTPDVHEEPGLYVSIRPAWNDRNLGYLSQHVKANSFCAHVRAASEGEVSEANCHPFHYGPYLFMHNEGIGDFAKIKRHVRRSLSDEIYDWIRGQTDSELFFAMVALRYVSDASEVASTLYYSIGDSYECRDGVCYTHTCRTSAAKRLNPHPRKARGFSPQST